MSGKPSREGVEELVDLTRRLAKVREEESEYYQAVHRLQHATETRQVLERQFKNKLEEMDLCVGNHGWQDRLAWVVERIITRDED